MSAQWQVEDVFGVSSLDAAMALLWLASASYSLEPDNS